MKFSLILATLNRAETVRYCIQSLLDQIYTDYEIIVIDQSDDDKTFEIVNSFSTNKIVYKHVNFKGLSKARNEGLKYSCGEYFCLIDDDAYYKDDYLQTAFRNISRNEKINAVYSGYIYDTIKDSAFANYNEKNSGKVLNIKSVIRTCPSAGLVIPRKVIAQCGGFDERLGVGAEFGAGEETDLLLRAVSKGFKVIYVSEMILKHPYPEKKERNVSEEASSKKMSNYYRGNGALFKKQIIYERNLHMVFPFIVQIIKFLAKFVLFFRFDHHRTKDEFCGWLQGVKNYQL